MGKVKKIGIWAGIAVGAFFVLIISIGLLNHGEPASTQTNTSTLTDTKENPQAISSPNTETNTYPQIAKFFVLGTPSESEYEVQFSLADKDGNQVATDGTATLSISQNACSNCGYQSVLYAKTLTIRKEDFRNTGGSSLSYTWTIPTADFIVKGVPYQDTATASLSLAFANGNTTATYSGVHVPSFTPKEFFSYLENKYVSSSNAINKSFEKNSVSVTLLRSGYYTEYYPSGYYGAKLYPEYLLDFTRIDFTVDTGQGGWNMPYESGFTLVDSDGKQYQAYSGRVIGSDATEKHFGKMLNPNEKVQGYLLFKTNSKNVMPMQLLISSGGQQYWTLKLN